MAVRARTEARLLDAADEVLFARGALVTPVDAILEHAGVSPATLYRAYGSKEGLIAAALNRRQRAWVEVWDTAIAQAADERGRLLAVFDALEAFRQRPGGALPGDAVVGSTVPAAEDRQDGRFDFGRRATMSW